MAEILKPPYRVIISTQVLRAVHVTRRPCFRRRAGQGNADHPSTRNHSGRASKFRGPPTLSITSSLWRQAFQTLGGHWAIREPRHRNLAVKSLSQSIPVAPFKYSPQRPHPPSWPTGRPGADGPAWGRRAAGSTAPAPILRRGLRRLALGGGAAARGGGGGGGG